MAEQSGMGHIVWADVTVGDAVGVRDFYREVVGWDVEPVDMGGYADFSMLTPGDGTPVAGVCHARGANADLPPQWLLYVTVADVEASARRCVDLGGEVVVGPRPLSGGRFCVVRDPAGAVLALYEAPVEHAAAAAAGS